MEKSIFQIGLKFGLQKLKILCHGYFLLIFLNNEEIIGTFYEKELQTTNNKNLKVEKLIRRKGNKLYIKWKGCNNSFNSWTDEKI